MNVGGGEAADQLVRMMLSGSEVAVRLSGSAIKNLLALTMALAKNHKTISGKVNMAKMLRETRDVRRFAMSPEQYQAFKKRAGKQKILFSAIRDTDGHGKVVDVIMPVTEIDRANLIFERIQYLGQPEQAQQSPQEGAPSKAREARVEADVPQTKQDQRPQTKAPVAPPSTLPATGKLTVPNKVPTKVPQPINKTAHQEIFLTFFLIPKNERANSQISPIA